MRFFLVGLLVVTLLAFANIALAEKITFGPNAGKEIPTSYENEERRNKAITDTLAALKASIDAQNVILQQQLQYIQGQYTLMTQMSQQMQSLVQLNTQAGLARQAAAARATNGAPNPAMGAGVPVISTPEAPKAPVR